MYLIVGLNLEFNIYISLSDYKADFSSAIFWYYSTFCVANFYTYTQIIYIILHPILLIYLIYSGRNCNYFLRLFLYTVRSHDQWTLNALIFFGPKRGLLLD